MNRQTSQRLLARRALIAVTLAASLASPSAEAQQKGAALRATVPRPPGLDVPLPPPPAGTRLERRGATLGVGVGPWAAFDQGKSIALHLDYGFPRTPLAWRRLELEYRLAVMLARPAYDTPLSRTILSPYTLTPTQMDTGVKKTRVWLVEAVPTARVRLPVGQAFAVFADGGVGLAQTVERYESEETFVGHSVKTRDVTGLVVRLGGGASFDVSERLRVLFLPIALSLQIGPGFGAYAPSLEIAYRM